MEFALIIWLISSMNAIGVLFLSLAVVSGFASVVGFITLSDPYDDESDKALKYKWIKRLLVTCLASFFIVAIIPSTKTAWMMAGAYTAQTALESETAKKLGKIVEVKLQEVLDEVTEQAKIKAKSINKEKE